MLIELNWSYVDLMDSSQVIILHSDYILYSISIRGGMRKTASAVPKAIPWA
jgi:hypothetical protein